MDEIGEYIDSIDQDWQRAVVERLRKTIHDVDEQVEEKIKWGSAAFERAGPLLWTFVTDKWVHISFPHGSLLDHSHGLFEPTESRAQRTIRIRKADKFPEKTLAGLISQAVKNNVEGKKVSFAATKPGAKKFNLPKEYVELLTQKELLEEYKKRPYYQQSGWVRWIESAKQQATKKRRQKQMFDELKAGNVYMKMPW